LTSWGAWARERFVKIVLPYWIAVIITFSLAALYFIWAQDSGQFQLSWMTLLTYLAFLRNFYEPGWTLNWTLWFMPVIIGLYVFFPILLLVMERAGITSLIVISLLVGNAAIAACVYWGYPLSHQAALPFFFVDEFALGMVLAWMTYHHPGRLRGLMKMRYFFLGIAVYTVATLISLYAWLGEGSSTYNDILQVIGLLLMLLYICRRMNETFSRRSIHVLGRVSDRSYTMYLIHGPIILYGLKPMIGAFMEKNSGPPVLLLFAGVFVLLTFALAEGISRLVMKFVPESMRTLPSRPL
jgi:peptidoglycan/LPS O-acetylase OafA/YrhL